MVYIVIINYNNTIIIKKIPRITMKFDAEIDLKNTDKHITKMRVTPRAKRRVNM